MIVDSTFLNKVSDFNDVSISKLQLVFGYEFFQQTLPLESIVRLVILRSIRVLIALEPSNLDSRIEGSRAISTFMDRSMTS